MVERQNLAEAPKRVQKNGGAPGVDGVGTKDLRPFLKLHWERIRAELLNGTDEPQPVRRVEIPSHPAFSRGWISGPADVPLEAAEVPRTETPGPKNLALPAKEQEFRPDHGEPRTPHRCIEPSDSPTGEPKGQ